jgi:uncharacterized protein HemX
VPQDFSNAVRAERHVFDYVFTDSAGERNFVQRLDTATEVVVYAKLPKQVDKAYRLGRLLAVRETDLDESIFPERCPYSPVQVTDTGYRPD